MKYSIEVLVHYQCPFCHQWFSIGDGPQSGSLACPNPNCGERSHVGEDATLEAGMRFVDDEGEEYLLSKFREEEGGDARYVLVCTGGGYYWASPADTPLGAFNEERWLFTRTGGGND